MSTLRPSRPAAALATLLAFGLMRLAACSDPARRHVGESCSDDGQCASGLCLESVCLDPAGDEDQDGLTNGVEGADGTNPLAADTDGDGVPDGTEVGSLPLSPVDGDGDGLYDALESSTLDADHDCLVDQVDPHNTAPDAPTAAAIAAVCPTDKGVCGAPDATLGVVCLVDPAHPSCVFEAVPFYEPTDTSCDGRDNNCDGATDDACVPEVAAAECDELPPAERTSGPHTIDPDGAGGKAPFTAQCLFELERGGWTRLAGDMVDAVQTQAASHRAREVFYRNGAAFYRSPVTTAAWTVSTFAEATGLWVHARGAAGQEEVLDCAGGLAGASGIGCANADGTVRVLPGDDFDAVAGTVVVCGAPTTPGDLASGCVPATEIWVRSRACIPDGKGLLGDGGFDLAAATNALSGSPCWREPPATAAGLAFSADDVRPGGKAPALVATSTAVPLGDLAIAQGKTSLIAGRAYRLTFWAKGKPAKTIHVRAGAGLTGTSATIAHEADVALTAAWSEYTVDFEVATTLWDAGVQLQLGGPSGAVFLDDVALVDVGPSSCPPCDFANANAECVHGTCTLGGCKGGFGNCDDRNDNGCETALGTLDDCKACGDACTYADGVGSCGADGCTLADCKPGFGNCDDSLANGCETALGTTAHCRSCQEACVFAGGDGACTAQGCVLTGCHGGVADCDHHPENGCETTLGTAANCLACADACTFTGGVGACTASGCALTGCVDGHADCDDDPESGCETVLGTRDDCLACFDACVFAGGVGACTASGCALAGCASGFADCDDDTADGCETPLGTTSDCTGCKNACVYPAGVGICGASGCALGGCTAGFANCDPSTANGCETPLGTVSDCLACGDACEFAFGTGVCTPAGCAMTGCVGGHADCDSDSSNGCETPLGTIDNCQGCDDSCAYEGGVGSCGASGCSFAGCTPGLANCDSNGANGCETTLGTLTDCKACRDACTYAHGGGVCGASGCAFTGCDAGFKDCDTNIPNGCETPLGTLANCKDCGDACSYPGATGACGANGCSFVGCNADKANCDDNTANGCETPLGTLSNCKSCGDACSYPSGNAVCGAAGCALGSCQAGAANCDQNNNNGCETPLGTLANCKSCGDACTYTDGVGACGANGCSLSGCQAGHADCDHAANNGCEVPLGTLTNCQGCGDACSFAFAAASCVAGAGGGCQMGACNAGHGNCDGQVATGCETPLGTLTNCLGCGDACTYAHAAASCGTGPGGGCAMGVCAAGFGDCNTSSADGCEKPLTTLTDCNGCGVVCARDHAAASCTTGTCALDACDLGYGDCDHQGANGCEEPLNTLNHCSACGSECAVANGTPSCATGACVVAACNDGFGDCNHQASDGCELDLHTDANNCGACGNVCDGGQSCVNSQCVFDGALAVRGGSGFGCALRVSGGIACWGQNGQGQLGDGTQTARTTAQTTIQPAAGETIAQLAVGSEHACLRYQSGKVACWGNNSYGQLGSPTATVPRSLTPLTVANLGTATDIQIGVNTTCAITSDKHVWCWGFGGNGELGNNTLNNSAVPVEVRNAAAVPISTAVGLALGQFHGCALTATGAAASAVCWGYNGSGQLGNGSNGSQRVAVPVQGTLQNATAIAAGSTGSCVVRSGALQPACWGGFGGPATTTTSVVSLDFGGSVTQVAMAIGGETTCALRTDGHVACVGGSAYGQLGNGTFYGLNGAVREVVRWSDLESLTNLSALGGGQNHLCAIDANKGVACWGEGWGLGDGQLTSPAPRNRSAAFPVVNLTATPIPSETAVCTNGRDDDHNGQTDCADSACATFLGSALDKVAAFPVDGTLGNYVQPAQSCAPNNAGRERRFRWVAPASDTYVISTVGSNANTVLDVRASGCSGAALVCNDDLDNGVGASRVELVANQDEEFTIIADNRTIDGLENVLLTIAPKSCTVRRLDCDGDAATGCEVDGAADRYNCGACGNTCGYDQRCADGTCVADAQAKTVALAAGTDFSCALSAAGAVACWGDNDAGQLADGTTVARTEARASLLTSGVTQLTAGSQHACALSTDGLVRCWGANSSGQSGRGYGGFYTEPVVVPTLTGVVEVEAGADSTCARTGTGEIWCWGSNGNGELGDGTSFNSSRPRKVTGVVATSAVSHALAVGRYHGCALTSLSAAKCWGYNGSGQLGRGNNTSSLTAVAVASGNLSSVTGIYAGGQATCATRSGTSPVCWGEWGGVGTTNAPTPTSFGATVTGFGILRGQATTCGVRSDGHAACMGSSYTGQTGSATFGTVSGAIREVVRWNDLDTLTGVTQVAGGELHACALDQSGAVYCWGAGLGLGDGQRVTVPRSRWSAFPVTGLAPVRGLGAQGAGETAQCTNGYDDDGDGLVDCSDAACATKLDNLTGKVAAYPVDGQLGNYTQPDPSCTYTGNIGRERTFRWVAPMDGNYIVSTAGSSANTSLEVRGAGCDVALLSCNDDAAPGDTASLVTLGAVNATEYTFVIDTRTADSIQHVQLTIVPETCPQSGGALDCDGVAANGCEVDGANDRYNCGRCGNVCAYDESCSANQCVRDTLAKPIAVAAGADFACALRGSGAVVCWGDNDAGQLGDGTTTTRREPRESLLTTKVVQITAGEGHACALLSDGHVQCWGKNDVGQVGRGIGDYYAVPVQVPTLANVVEVRASSRVTCARTAAGDVYCWGYNGNGELGDGTNFNTSRPNKVPGVTVPYNAQVTPTPVALAVGLYHACAQTGPSAAKCWGYNGSGQLGNASYTSSLTPVAVSSANLSNVSGLYAGNQGTCATRTGLAPVCWGTWGGVSQTNVPTVTSFGANVVAFGMTQGGATTCGVRTDQRVACMGASYKGQTGSATFGTVNGAIREVVRWNDLDSLTGIVAVSGGDLHACALDTAGAVYCWGAGGGLGDGQSSATPRSRWSAFPVTSLAPVVKLDQLGAGETALCMNSVDDDHDGTSDCHDLACSAVLGTALGLVATVPVDGQLGNYSQPSAGCASTSAVGREVRYRWVAPETRDYVVATVGSTANTSVDVQVADCSGTSIVCNDDLAVNDSDSRVTLPATQGTEYLIVVDTRTVDVIENIALAIVPETCAGGGGRLECDGDLATGCEIDGTTDRYNCGACGHACPFDNACVSGQCEPALGARVNGVAGGDDFTCVNRGSGAVACWGVNTSGQLGDGSLVSRTVPRETPITNVKMVTAGTAHACALKADGTVWCWGKNDVGQVGRGIGDFYTEPVRVPALTGVAEVRASHQTTCAMTTGGEVWCWGYNGDGELGDGTTFNSSRPLKVPGVSAIGIAVGHYHACALTSGTSAKCWGYNGSGQLGNGNNTSSLVPVAVASGNLTGLTAIAAGNQGTCAVRFGLAPVCWGTWGGPNTANAPTLADFGGSVTALAVLQESSTTCAVRADQRVVCMGAGSSGQLGAGSFGSLSGAPREVVRWSDLDSLTGLRAIGGGGLHACAADVSGAVYCWGAGLGLGDGQLVGAPKSRWSAFPVTSMAPVVPAAQLGAGETALCMNGVDDDANGQADCADAACATYLGSALGKVAAAPIDGQQGNYSQPSVGCVNASFTGREKRYRWVAPATGNFVFSTEGSTADTSVDVRAAGCGGGSLACSDDGVGLQARLTLGVTQGTEYTIVVDDRTPDRIDNILLSIVPETCAAQSGRLDCDASSANGCEVDSAGDRYNCGACGKVCAYDHMCVAGACVPGPLPSAVAGGDDFACARRDDGKTECWGTNTYGQLGDGTTTSRTEPRSVFQNDVGSIQQPTAGYGHVCGLTTDAHVVCWGRNNYGQVGRGIGDDYTTPVVVPTLSNIVEVRANANQTCARGVNGEVWCWGYNTDGELGDGTGFDSGRPVKVVGITATAIAVGEYHACALTSATSAKCWGYNGNGQLGNGNNTSSKTPVAVSTGNLVNLTGIFAGSQGTCATRANADPVCWGSYGGATTNNTPKINSFGGNVITLALAQNAATTCAVRADSSIACMGANDNGELGNQSFTASNGTAVGLVRWDQGSNSGWSMLGAGSTHMCAVGTPRTVFCWGTGAALGDGQKVGQAKDRFSAFPVNTLAPTTRETGMCTNGYDDDGDGALDCSDSDCATNTPSIVPATQAFTIDGSLGNYSQGAVGCVAASSTGREKRYRWIAPQTASYTITAAPNTVLDVRATGCSGAGIVCDNKLNNAAPAQVTLSATGGDEYTIVVDTALSNQAPISGTLIITLSP